jgi:hypothetical protein
MFDVPFEASTMQPLVDQSGWEAVPFRIAAE